MRGTGKTLAMVKAIPEEGGVILIHHYTMAVYIRRMIADVRGEAVLDQCRFFVVGKADDLDVIRGLKSVFVDNAVHENASPELAAALREHGVSVRFLCGEENVDA